MSPVDALARLRAHPGDAAAWVVVVDLLRVLAHRATSDRDLQQGATEAVRQNLEDRLLDGDLPEIQAPLAYLGNAVRWRVRDLVRRRVRRAAAAERAQSAVAPAPAPELPPETFELLERVAARALSRRDPWQRAHLERSWQQIKAIHLEDASLRDLVVRDDGLDPANEADVNLAVQRAHKAHQRARKAFEDALSSLTAQKAIDPESAFVLRAAIGRLKRRQDRARSGVSLTSEPTV